MAIETEFKFLISMPSDNILSPLEGDDIEQLYMPPTGDYHSERIRARRHGNSVVYTHTKKRSISTISAIEDEEVIDEAEFLAYRQKCTSSLTKKRYVMPCGGFLYEIDVYPFWQHVAVLEVEFTEGGEVPSVPPCFHVIRDVTDDHKFKNHSLSIKAPDESDILKPQG